MHSMLASALLVATIALPTIMQGQNVALPGHLIDIKVGEYFIIAPDSAPAGLVTLRLTQTGDAVKRWPADIARLRADPTYHFHMVWLVRLDSSRTFSDLFEAERDHQPTPWATVLGGPGFADAPGSSNVSLVLTPGNYALVCYVGSAREDRSRYHLLKGMIRPITVTAGHSRPESLPTTDLTIVLRGDSVLVPDTLQAGVRRLLVRNEGAGPTDFGVSLVKGGYTVAEARAWRSRMMTEPPRYSVGGVVFVTPGRTLVTTVSLQKGNYLFGSKHVVVRE